MTEQIKELINMLSGFGSQRMEDVGVVGFVFVMAISLICTTFVSYLYTYFFLKRTTGSQVHRSFPLLGISITAIFICIQFSLPLSLGLLGALSIVRFRTPIKEPEEIGFIMLVIAVSISCATFNFIFLGIVLIIGIAGCVIMTRDTKYISGNVYDGIIMITMSDIEFTKRTEKILKYFDTAFDYGKLESITKNEGSSIVSYSFKRLKNKTFSELQEELRTLIGENNYNIYLHKPGDIASI